MTDIVDRLNDSLSAGYSELRKEAALEIERLRAKIEQMEKQVPICRAEDLRHAEILLPSLSLMPEDKLYALPGAQPAPSVQDASVRKAWARFSHELHRSPDAPYPGMADAFEQHFSQSFIDREWKAEAATWAAAWKAAKRHCAQPAPSVPEGVSFIDTSQLEGVVSTEIVHSYPPPSGWLRAIDEALVTTHIGVANAHDTYEQAKAKLDSLIGFHVDVATDPAVNGGFKLMPNGWEANLLIVEHAMRMNNWDWNSNTPDDLKRSAYKIISNLLAAPEAK